LYFDENNVAIKTDFVSKERSGDFKETFTNTLRTPKDTNHVKLQLWVKSNPERTSSYLLDDVKIKQLCPQVFNNNFELFENVNPQYQTISINEDSLEVHIKQGWRWNLVKTKPLLVNDNMLLNYTITVETQNVNSFHSEIVFSGSKVEDRYGSSNGEVIALTPGSEVFTELDVLKTSRYTIAARIKTYEEGALLKVKIGDIYKEFSLNRNETDFRWLYFSTNLTRGKTDLRIYSNRETDLDIVIVYSGNESVDDLFTSKETPAQLISYEKHDPTRYKIQVNATEPFMLAFAETYDPLWTAEVNGDKIGSIPLYSIINGFWINETGNLNITIEYEPQRWLYYGLVISLSTFLGSIGYLVWCWRKNQKSYD
jgi:hypothetical protein